MTADALHCHPAMAAAVLAAKAQYALGLKGNHGPLFAAAEKGFAAAADLAFFETRERAHGRSERRRASVLPVSRLPDAPDFPGLKAIGRIEAERTATDGKPATSVRYVALSRVLSPAKLAASRSRPLEHREPAPLDPRRRLRRGRCPHPQGQRPTKPRRHPPPRPEHLASPPPRQTPRQQNATGKVEQRILLRTLCPYAIALGGRGRLPRPTMKRPMNDTAATPKADRLSARRPVARASRSSRRRSARGGRRRRPSSARSTGGASRGRRSSSSMTGRPSPTGCRTTGTSSPAS